MSLAQKIGEHIREIPNFPKEGILFKDITSLLLRPDLCSAITQHMARQYAHIDAVAGIESRGFFWGMSVAQQLGIPFIPIRKAGKLPGPTIAQSYALEYGEAEIEVQVDDLNPSWKVLIHDDLLATGGTAEAAAKLIEQKSQIAGFSFIIELSFLNGRNRLLPFGKSVDSLLIE